MFVVDANVLLYAVNADSAHHRDARDWLDRVLAGPESVGLAWSVILAFLRLATHPVVFPRPLDAGDATRVVRGWLGSPVATPLEPTDQHLRILTRLLDEAGTAGNLVSDAHLAALAIEHDGTLVSYDADFSRFEGLRWQRPAPA
jgi:uncharacterized protein